MTRHLWFNPVFGVAGDMILGALFDAGADLEFVRGQLNTLEMEGWDLRLESASRRGLNSCRAVVTAPEQEHRPWSLIDSSLEAAALEPSVKDGARATFLAIARAEAERHGIDVDEVEFHEVGAVDAIVDVVGAWAALASLEVDRVGSGPVGLGAGSVQASHGGLPHPAPAVLELCRGLPVTSVESSAETATPTGVALLKTMVQHWGPIPGGTLLESGFGAGGRDPESYANVLSVALVDEIAPEKTDSVVLATNVDDVTPETIGYVVETILQAGADDAWVVPIVMKKGRPGHEIRVLCSPALAPEVLAVLARETGTLGARSTAVAKTVYPRTTGTVTVQGHAVGIKSGPYGTKPEYEDLKKAAIATGLTLDEVREAALEAWREDSLA